VTYTFDPKTVDMFGDNDTKFHLRRRCRGRYGGCIDYNVDPSVTSTGTSSPWIPGHGACGKPSPNHLFTVGVIEFWSSNPLSPPPGQAQVGA
jgi:hypothetical protein